MSNALDLLAPSWHAEHYASVEEAVVAQQMASAQGRSFSHRLECNMLSKGKHKRITLHFYCMNDGTPSIVFHRLVRGSGNSSTCTGSSNGDSIRNNLADGKCEVLPQYPRVLLVDDNAVHVTTLKRMLNPLVHNLAVLPSGEKFLEYAVADPDSHEYDIVILDNHMDGMDGSDALGKAREHDYTGAVIMCSGTESDKWDLFSAHSDLVLNKNSVKREDFKAAFRGLGWPKIRTVS